MSDGGALAERFESERSRLRAVAYRMLGSSSAADHAVQEAWLRLDRTDATEIDNLAGWLTVVVSRICLDMIRVRDARVEPDPLPRQREVVDAFLAAARAGDFQELLTVLDPECVLRADAGSRMADLAQTVRGADDVAGRAIRFSSSAQEEEHVLVNGAAGVLVGQGGGCSR